MFVFTKEDMERFAAEQRPDELEKLEAWLIKDYPFLDDGTLYDRLDPIVTEAEALGLFSTADIYTYTEYRIVHEFDLVNDPDMQAVLQDASVSGANRMLDFLLRKPPAFWRQSPYFTRQFSEDE